MNNSCDDDEFEEVLNYVFDLCVSCEVFYKKWTEGKPNNMSEEKRTDTFAKTGYTFGNCSTQASSPQGIIESTKVTDNQFKKRDITLKLPIENEPDQVSNVIESVPVTEVAEKEMESDDSDYTEELIASAKSE